MNKLMECWNLQTSDINLKLMISTELENFDNVYYLLFIVNLEWMIPPIK
jgi:hypothetical protein